MKSPDSTAYSRQETLINTNIEKLVKGKFTPNIGGAHYNVIIPKENEGNRKGLFKMIMGMVYFVSLVYFLTKLLT